MVGPGWALSRLARSDFHTSSPDRALDRWSLAAKFHRRGGPQSELRTAGPGRALKRRALAGPSNSWLQPRFHTVNAAGSSVGGSQPGFHTVGLGRAFTRWAPGRLSYGGPSRAFIWRTRTGPSTGRLRLGFHLKASKDSSCESPAWTRRSLPKCESCQTFS